MINFFRIGYVISTHGIKGEMKCTVTSDEFKKFSSIKNVYLVPTNVKDFNTNGLSKENYIHNLENVKYVNNAAVIKLDKIDNIDVASKYIKYDIYIDRKDALPLSKNEYYIPDLIGLKLIDKDNNFLATVVDVIDNLSQAKLIVKDENSNKEYIIPMVSEFISNIDLDKRNIEVNLIKGLLDDDI